MFLLLGIALLLTMVYLEDEQGMLPQTLYTAVEFVAAEAPHVWINNDSQNREQKLYFKQKKLSIFCALRGQFTRFS